MGRYYLYSIYEYEVFNLIDKLVILNAHLIQKFKLNMYSYVVL